MSKPILFIDFDGTLCHDRFWRSLPGDQYKKVQTLLFQENMSFAEEWMRGKWAAEEVNQFLAEKLDIPFQELWNIFVSDAQTMYVSKEVLETIEELRNKYTTILITVNMDSFARFTVPALSLEDYFDDISNSYYEGKFKSDNEGEVFRDYINKYSAPLEHSILIDDSTGACETFKALGGIAYQVTTEEDISHHLTQLKKF
jgi:FMN phosphatase YigB (HAD superfamily)